MAINLAKKYSSKVDEKFKLGALTNSAVNHDYDWVGAATVAVYGLSTVPLNNYARTGTNRYGSPTEVQDTKQELTIKRDRSFSFTIDRGNYDETAMVRESGKMLAREIDEQIIPEIDQYRLAVAIANAKKVDTTQITTSNAYAKFLAANEAISEEKAPANGRVAYVSYAYYSLLKQDSSFIKSSDMGQKILIKGQVGEADGVAIVPVPKSYILGADFVIMHKSAITAPTTLDTYKIHDNPPGINGWLVEGRVRYDAFALDNKTGALALQMYGTGITLTTSAGEVASGKSVVSAEGWDLPLLVDAGLDVCVYTGSAVTALAKGAAAVAGTTSGVSEWDAEGNSATATHKLQLIICKDGKVLIPGTLVTLA